MARHTKHLDVSRTDPEIVCHYTVVANSGHHVSELMDWAEDAARPGWYRCESASYGPIMRGMRIVVDENGNVLKPGQVMFGFSDPDVAFEFKVRWG